MPTTLSNKREVRDYVKQALQACVDAQLLDVEDQKGLIKSVSDAADVPVEDQAVGAAVYKGVLQHLTDNEVAEATVAQITALLAPLQAAPKTGDGADTTAGLGTATVTSSIAAEKKPGLSLSGLKARLAKRREEMERPPSQSNATTEPRVEMVPSLSATREGSIAATTELDRVSLADGTESYRPTAPATADVSPMIGPAVAMVSPPPAPHEDRDDAARSQRTSEPPAKRERVEVVLSAAPLDDADLYAGLPLYQPRGRGMGGMGGMGGYRGGRGRGGRGYGPSPYGPPPPQFARGGYAGAPHDAYAGPPPPDPVPAYGGGPTYRGRGGGYAGSQPYGAPRPSYLAPPPGPYRGRYPS